ncbi:Uu.00g041550.m01.CDS01 [Anthostomella pinea]|uniref:Uu.00g041550.m01.CDS01 n=1 Tax=Anthostomella pinea TaxID=933095 RepID=A0AAI8YE20_9PEZI|nr:Uu.00g041550.m01.CDS01 [Anthostomella pinea]
MFNPQQNMQASDDLAALFSRNLTFQPQPVQEAPQEQPRPQATEPEPIRYSITQHYHHSAHVAQHDEPLVEPQRPSSEPPQTQQPAAEMILSQHGVDPSGLSSAQLELFKLAEDTQKMRLIELWRICPPTNTQNNPGVAWHNTSVENEELLAQLRYEQRLAEEEQKNSMVMSMDGTPLTPVQTAEGHWVPTSCVEPYMMSGYEALARRDYEDSAKQQYEDAMSRPKDVYNHFGSAPTYRPATDPVYNDKWASQQRTMEDQYGAYQMGGMEF